MTAARPRTPTKSRARQRPPDLLHDLIAVAMEFERRTMQLYCRFENLFREPVELREFWLEMAEHEARHFGGLALVTALLEATPERLLPRVRNVEGAHVEHLGKLLARAEREAMRGVTLRRAFEIALDIESSEIDDLVLDLLTLLNGEAERERAVRFLIHDLGDLSYMVEKYGRSKALLARADTLIEQQVDRLRERQKPRPGAARR